MLPALKKTEIEMGVRCEVAVDFVEFCKFFFHKTFQKVAGLL
jgi:hypothetical protein